MGLDIIHKEARQGAFVELFLLNVAVGQLIDTLAKHPEYGDRNAGVIHQVCLAVFDC